MGGRSERGKWDQTEELRFLLYEGPIHIAMRFSDYETNNMPLKRFYWGYLKSIDLRKKWWIGVNKTELRNWAKKLFENPPLVSKRMEGNKTNWYVKVIGRAKRRIHHN